MFLNLGKPTPEQFAQLMIGQLKKIGITDPIRFDPVKFSLSWKQGQAMYLHNAHTDYCRAPWRERAEALTRYAGTAIEATEDMPKGFAEAQTHLLPRVRERAFYPLAYLRLQAEGHQPSDLPTQPLSDSLIVDLAYDRPDSIGSVNDAALTGWGVTFEQALAVARDNLWKMSNQAFQQPVPGLYLSPWQDTYDASRLFLHDLVWQMKVKGDPVAMVPSRNYLLVTGADDAAALTLMAELVGQILEKETRQMTGMAVRLQGKQWVPFLPPPEHPAYAKLALLAYQSRGKDYAEQTELLKAQYEKAGTDIFVAGYKAMQNKQTGRIRSTAVWAEGVDTRLPLTDRVAFVQADAADAQKGRILGSAPWARVQQVAGGLMAPVKGLYPERFRMQGFPSSQQLEEIGLEQEA